MMKLKRYVLVLTLTQQMFWWWFEVSPRKGGRFCVQMPKESRKQGETDAVVFLS